MTNLCVVSGDAEAVLGRHVEPASVAQVLDEFSVPRDSWPAEAEAAFAWLRRQRDDPRQSTEVRARSAAAGMLELRCGKDVRLQLSVPHRDKLHELYCRTVARRVGVSLS